MLRAVIIWLVTRLMLFLIITIYNRIPPINDTHKVQINFESFHQHLDFKPRRDGLVLSVSNSHAVGRGFATRPGHTKDRR